MKKLLPISLLAALLLCACSTEYLVIVPDGYENAMIPLLQAKLNAGLMPYLVRLSDIGADPSAEDIAEHIRDEFERSGGRLRYVLLVGDSDLLPTHYVSGFGEVDIATDLYYGVVDGDDYLPELCVGRLPVRSVTQAHDIVRRIIDYRPATARVLLFGNSPEMDYADDHEPILTADGFIVDKLRDEEAHTETVDRLYDGRLVAAYYGHGLRQSADDALTFTDAHFLSNSVLPVVLSGGCHNGEFDSTITRCLGEALVIKQTGGAIAFIGSTRSGGYGHEYTFLEGFFSALDDADTLGQMFNEGRYAAYDAADAAGMDVGDGSFTKAFVEKITLLGDPALVVGPAFLVPPAFMLVEEPPRPPPEPPPESPVEPLPEEPEEDPPHESPQLPPMDPTHRPPN